jgi:hypothetical protein
MKSLITKFFDLLRKLGTQRRHQVAFGVFFGGLAMMISSHLLAENEVGSHLVQVLLLEVGIACIIASIAEFILLEHVSQIFRQEVREDIKILSHCMEHQLVDILPPCSDEQNLAVKEINSAVEKSRGEICILAGTLLDIRHSDTLLRGPLQKLINNNEEVEVKFLLIDPKGNGARIRVKAEEGSNIRVPESQLYNDLCSSINFIQKKMKQAKDKDSRFKIEARFYNTLPNFYMISTASDIFIELTHLGYNIAGGAPVDGDSPLFRFSSKSTMYELARSHFLYIWNLPESLAQHSNGDIKVRTMEDVCREFERRGVRRERRTQVLPVERDRRTQSDRRDLIAS